MRSHGTESKARDRAVAPLPYRMRFVGSLVVLAIIAVVGVAILVYIAHTGDFNRFVPSAAWAWILTTILCVSFTYATVVGILSNTSDFGLEPLVHIEDSGGQPVLVLAKRDDFLRRQRVALRESVLTLEVPAESSANAFASICTVRISCGDESQLVKSALGSDAVIQAFSNACADKGLDLRVRQQHVP